MASEKKCAACGAVKPLSEFYRRGDRDAPRSKCIECMRVERAGSASRHAARAAAWRARDLDRARKSVRDCNAKHRPKRRSANRARWANDPDYRRASADGHRVWKTNNSARWRKIQQAHSNKRRELKPNYFRDYARANPDKWRAYRARRRAAERGAIGFYTDADVLAIRAFQSDRCACCPAELSGRGAVDHIRPLSRGGTNWPRNLQLLCTRCNSRKRNKDFLDFLVEIGLVCVGANTMKVYLTGDKERANPRHVMYVCPARVLPAAECPTAWREDNGEPKTFEVVFAHGLAIVDDQLGAWLTRTGQASLTPRTVLRVGRSIFGALTTALGGAAPLTHR